MKHDSLVWADPGPKQARTPFRFSHKIGCYKYHSCIVIPEHAVKTFHTHTKGNRYPIRDYLNYNTYYCVYIKLPVHINICEKTLGSLVQHFQRHQSDIRTNWKRPNELIWTSSLYHIGHLSLVDIRSTNLGDWWWNTITVLWEVETAIVCCTMEHSGFTR